MLTLLLLFLFLIITSYQDLKTTEIDDKLPYLFSFLFILISLTNNTFFNSLIIALTFYTIGYIFYVTGQWGYGDTAILTTVGFALGSIFEFEKAFLYLFNVFVFGALYIIAYSFVISFKNKKVRKVFSERVVKNKNRLMLAFFVLLIIFYLPYSFVLSYEYSLVLAFALSSLFVLLYLLMTYLKIVDRIVMKRKIPIEKLKVGDVIADSRLWRGITKKELQELRKKKKYVWVKEGVRFAPAFLLALIFTLLSWF